MKIGTNRVCRMAILAVATLFAMPAGFHSAAQAQPATRPGEEPPTSWIDADTGHRVIRLTKEPGSDSFYFNYNPFTPDGKKMAYMTPDSIGVIDLTTLQSRTLVKGASKTIIVGHKTPTLYYSQPTKEPYFSTLWSVNLESGEIKKLADLPRRASVVTINADETLGAGTYIEGDANAGGAYDGTPQQAPSRMGAQNMGEPANKGQMMAQRLAAKLPMTMFTINLQTGKIFNLLEHSTDWLNHLQFSPADPTHLMYCHEGGWSRVDRIWTINTDGTGNKLVHQRTMENEIAGHEWWGADGKTIFYQLHYPSGMQSSFVSSFNVETGDRTWLHYTPDMTSIHCNSSPDGKLFTGDGGKATPWIFLMRPVVNQDRGTLGKNLIHGGHMEAEKLVGMSKHNYRLEPNPIFTPDMKYIIFRSNMFGPDYAFAVEIAKAQK
ncbi:MAG TPA: oligogalacturonate lyase family protein [Tepidisphaeraceae bacterium]|nr:oligogalacturonate lyase family protein [Tepidisphaeraceae bacterium]